MHLKELVTDHATGGFSHTKLWANIGYLTLTYAFLADAIAGGLDAEKIFAYGAVVAGSATASKFLSLRYGVKKDDTNS